MTIMFYVVDIVHIYIEALFVLFFVFNAACVVVYITKNELSEVTATSLFSNWGLFRLKINFRIHSTLLYYYKA